eukprot:TRINITY_DN50987_c0_g1_i1.p2 TRINITY_DN50987_c0_g1~~TRINITY_DN50987_c0_g1_i1.p2  ORF type:complete len:329 (+),score=98.65 TRINITY_DN50987_c0_g1_i1:84-989(+)
MPELPVFVRLPSGETLSVDVPPDATIATVEQEIRRRTGNQCLVIPMWDGRPVSHSSVLGDLGVCAEAVLHAQDCNQVCRQALLWLDAARVRDELPPGGSRAVDCWRSRAEEERKLVGHPGSRPVFDPEQCAVSFNYDAWGTIEPAFKEEQTKDVLTIVSVHKFNPITWPGRKNFYILCGARQGALHGGDGGTHGYGSGNGWGAKRQISQAGGDFVDGTHVTNWFDFSVATMVADCRECDNVNWPGGVNRIGRDRDCHEFKGAVKEVLVFAGQLPTDQLAVVESYLASKWGLPCAARTGGPK